MIPGEIFPQKGFLEINAGRPTEKLRVVHRGDRPIQVGSHFHFFEVNRWLRFDRAKAFGRRLNIPAGTAVRFEPGDTQDVELVAWGGRKKAYGFNGLAEGGTSAQALARARKLGFTHEA